VKSRYRTRFRAQVALQVAFLVATILLLGWSLTSAGYVAVTVVIGLAIALQVAGLLHTVEAHVDTLEDFFAAINYEDFSRQYVAEDVDAELKDAFNRVIERFRDARAERDVKAGYLETVVKHVPVPFIAARADGSLSLVNNPARRLTGLPALSHLDDLAALDPGLPRQMREIPPGGRRLLQSSVRGVPAELRISVSEIRLEGGVERLYSIENLSGELTARESSAWRNLIRVLTHEIMNTLTPVTSLAQTTSGMLERTAASADIRQAVETIARRSEGLTNFVMRYRELLRLPQPDITRIVVNDALHGVVTLMGADLGDIDVSIDVTPASLEVAADRALLDQVLVNIVKNALDAVGEAGNGRIALRGRLELGRVVISVRDNGTGIDAEALAQVFVPFFTTKRGGSGIGLSLCRQIMTAHGGEIAIASDGDGTTVSLVF